MEGQPAAAAAALCRHPASRTGAAERYAPGVSLTCCGDAVSDIGVAHLNTESSERESSSGEVAAAAAVELGLVVRRLAGKRYQ